MRKFFRMSTLKTILFQTSAVAIQFAPIFPEEYQGTVHATVTILQGVQALLALHSNPDGTPAEVSYRPQVHGITNRSTQ